MYLQLQAQVTNGYSSIFTTTTKILFALEHSDGKKIAIYSVLVLLRNRIEIFARNFKSTLKQDTQGAVFK